MRASNEDRERVATALQKAMSDGRITVAELESRLDSVYAAKTLADLEPLTRDLPGAALSVPRPAEAVRPAPPQLRPLAPSGSGPSQANLVGIMSSVVRKGLWVVPERINGAAVMGTIELDFSGAQLTSMETVINAVAIMGTVDVMVPDGITVIVEGAGIMGTFEDHVQQVYGAEAPVLRLKGLALMGTVNVKRSKKSIGS